MVTIDIKDLKGLTGTYSVKFGKMKKYIKIDDDKVTLFGRIKSYAHGGWCHYKIQEIQLSKQKTGFGYKSFFVCAECGERRTKIYCHENRENFVCRDCIGNNIYKHRTNIYDEGGEWLIVYKINKLAKKLGVRSSDIKYPINKLDFYDKRPKYMRYKEFETILNQLEILEDLRFNVIFMNDKYSASEINKLINISGDSNG